MKLTYYCVYNVIMIVIGSSLACLNKIILLKGLCEVRCLGFFNAKFKVPVKT